MNHRLFIFAALAALALLWASTGAVRAEVMLGTCDLVHMLHPKPPEACQPLCRHYVACRSGRRIARACETWKCNRRWW
jgi:hypothetical protein